MSSCIGRVPLLCAASPQRTQVKHGFLLSQDHVQAVLILVAAVDTMLHNAQLLLAMGIAVIGVNTRMVLKKSTALMYFTGDAILATAAPTPATTATNASINASNNSNVTNASNK